MSGFTHSSYGYWIDAQRVISPLETPQSHADHPAIAHFPGEGLERMQAALDAGMAAVSIHGDSFAIRARAGAIPLAVVGCLRKIVEFHRPETVSTDHHGSGPANEVLAVMRQGASMSSFATPWEEIAALRGQLAEKSAELSAYKAMATDGEASEKLASVIKNIEGFRSQFRLIEINHKKAVEIDLDPKLSIEEKHEAFGYRIFHELSRNIWYCGTLLRDILK